MSLALMWLAAAVLLLPGGGPQRSRLGGLTATGRRAPYPPAPALLGSLAALVTLAWRPTTAGAVLAAVVGVFAASAARPWPTTRSGPARCDPAALSLGLELIAAALRAGAPLATAALAVCDVPGLVVGPQLAKAATMLQLGADPADAWSVFASRADGALIGAAAARSARSGMRLADMVSRHAELCRAEAHAAASKRAHRAAAFSLLPLGLCYLPAFICLGIVPMVAGLAAQAGRMGR